MSSVVLTIGPTYVYTYPEILISVHPEYVLSIVLATAPTVRPCGTPYTKCYFACRSAIVLELVFRAQLVLPHVYRVTLNFRGVV